MCKRGGKKKTNKQTELPQFQPHNLTLFLPQEILKKVINPFISAPNPYFFIKEKVKNKKQKL